MNWHEYFMGIAAAVAARSKDPATKVGAVLVDRNRHIIGTGYNGMPPGIVEEGLWDDRDTKYKYVIHAEDNCLLHATQVPAGSTMYVTLSPCSKCLGRLIAAGITTVIYRDYRIDRDREELQRRNQPIMLFDLEEIRQYESRS